MSNQIVHHFPRRKGEAIYLSLTEFKARKYIDLRLFFQPPNSTEMHPTRKGLTLEIELLAQLKNGIEIFEKKLHQFQSTE